MAKIVIDPGHGGPETGAFFEGRAEKDDNLRLGLAVARELRGRGQQVLMTRSDDSAVSLERRTLIANQGRADLFISLHRGISVAPEDTGWEALISLTAGEDPEQAADLVARKAAGVSGTANRGIRRGSRYILRRTRMPAILLHCGFINNEGDNRLFDQNLDTYARAIACGALHYFGIPYEPEDAPEAIAADDGADALREDEPRTAIADDDGADALRETVRAIQRMLNGYYGAGLALDGISGPMTQKALISAVQLTLNQRCSASLVVDGVFGPLTASAVPTLIRDDLGDLVYLLQAALFLNGYDTGDIDGNYDAHTAAALSGFQRDRNLIVDGIAGPDTIRALFHADSRQPLP